MSALHDGIPQCDRDTVTRLVQEHGVLAVLRLILNALDVVVYKLGSRGDIVGANDMLRRKDILSRAYKEWHRS